MAPSRNSSNFKNIRVEEIRRAGWFPTAIDIPMAARATLIHLAGQTGRPICGGIGNASISRSKHRSAVNDTQWLGDDKETAVPLIANSGCALAGSDDPACLKMALSLGAARCVRNAEPPPSEKSKGVVTG